MRTSLNSKPISEIHQQFVLGNVNLSPDYQRKLVWPYKNKVYLIDSIIQGLPLPLSSYCSLAYALNSLMFIFATSLFSFIP